MGCGEYGIGQFGMVASGPVNLAIAKTPYSGAKEVCLFKEKVQETFDMLRSGKIDDKKACNVLVKSHDTDVTELSEAIQWFKGLLSEVIINFIEVGYGIFIDYQGVIFLFYRTTRGLDFFMMKNGNGKGMEGKTVCNVRKESGELKYDIITTH